MSKRVFSLVLLIVAIGMVAAARKPSDQWMERMGCFLIGPAIVIWITDLKERRGKKQP